MQEYKPGPWKVVKNRGNHWGMVEVEGPGIGGFLMIGFTVATTITPERAKAIEAEAKLIAAAPDLLAALEAFVEDAKNDGISHDKLCLNGQAAIKKARIV
jgi:hypothetical protein